MRCFLMDFDQKMRFQAFPEKDGYLNRFFKLVKTTGNMTIHTLQVAVMLELKGYLLCFYGVIMDVNVDTGRKMKMCQKRAPVARSLYFVGQGYVFFIAGHGSVDAAGGIKR